VLTVDFERGDAQLSALGLRMFLAITIIIRITAVQIIVGLLP